MKDFSISELKKMKASEMADQIISVGKYIIKISRSEKKWLKI